MGEAKKLFSNSGIIFVGTLVGSFFSYLFNMLVGRWLGPEQYGQFAALLSLMMIISVFGGAVLTVTMKYSSELYALEKYNALRKLFKVFSKYVLFLGLILFFLSLIFVKPISIFFGIGNIASIVITLFSFIFGFMMVVNRGVLQGTQRFTALSILGVLESALRLAIGLLLIKLGMALSGAMVGVVFSTVIAYFISFFPIKKIFSNKEVKGESFVFNKKEIIGYTGPTLLATILLVASINMDILLVKHYFSAEEAGIYAAISTISKIILYATGPIVAVMFPMITEKRATGDKHFKLFLASLMFTLLGSLIILGLYNIAPGAVIKTLYGSKFVSNYSLLPQLGFVILLYSLINIMANYFISIKNFMFIPVFSIILVAQVMLISRYHSTLEVVIKTLNLTFGLLFIFLIAYYLFTKKDQLFAYFKGEYGTES